MSKTIHARIDDATHDKLHVLAEKQSRTISSLIAYALRLFVSKPKKAGK